MNEKSDAFKSDFAKIDATPGVPDEALPEVTDEMLDRAVFSVGDRVLPTPKRRGRPVNSGNKTSTTVRFSNDVLAYFKATGKGWQTRMDDALREWIATQATSISPAQPPLSGERAD